MGFNSPFTVSIRNVRSPRSSYCSLQQLFAALLTQERVCVTKFAENNIWTAFKSLISYIHSWMHILWKYKIIFNSHPAKSYRIDKNCPKCRETPSQSRFVHNILVPPKCTVPKSGWIPWNDRFISDSKVQINYRAVVTKYFELVLRGSIETKSVKPRQTADNKIAYENYLLKKVQCLGHEKNYVT